MSTRDVSTLFIEMKCRSPGEVLSAQGYARSSCTRPRGPTSVMLLAQPLAVPCGVATMESYLPLLSLKLAEDCQSGSARQGTVDLLRSSFPDASISYVGCVQGFPRCSAARVLGYAWWQRQTLGLGIPM